MENINTTDVWHTQGAILLFSFHCIYSAAWMLFLSAWAQNGLPAWTFSLINLSIISCCCCHSLFLHRFGGFLQPVVPFFLSVCCSSRSCCCFSCFLTAFQPYFTCSCSTCFLKILLLAQTSCLHVSAIAWISCNWFDIFLLQQHFFLMKKFFTYRGGIMMIVLKMMTMQQWESFELIKVVYHILVDFAVLFILWSRKHIL